MALVEHIRCFYCGTEVPVILSNKQHPSQTKCLVCRKGSRLEELYGDNEEWIHLLEGPDALKAFRRWSCNRTPLSTRKILAELLNKP